MLDQPVLGATYLLRGLRLLGRPGLRRYVVLPLLVNAIVFGVLIVLAHDEVGALVHHLIPSLPAWLSWLTWIIWALFWLVTVVIVFFTFSIIANLIAAPFNSLLAEAVERHLTGAPPPSAPLWQVVKETPSALLDELRKLGYYAIWAIPLLLLFLVPLVNLAAPFLWGLFSAWMMAVQYADYPMGNHQMLGKEQRTRLRQYRLFSLGFGGLTLFATMVPLVNFLVMPAAVAGATAMWVDRLRNPPAS